MVWCRWYEGCDGGDGGGACGRSEVEIWVDVSDSVLPFGSCVSSSSSVSSVFLMIVVDGTGSPMILNRVLAVRMDAWSSSV